MPTAQQLAVPFRMENGQVATVDQDSMEEIRSCVLACLGTKLGSRLEAPEYGVADQTFKRQARIPSADVFLRAVEDVEPRAALLGQVEFEDLVERVLITQGVTRV